MLHGCHYYSPIGKIFLCADDDALTALIFDGDKYFNADFEYTDDDTPILNQTKNWLDIYFGGREPNFTPPLNITGTPFRLRVWQTLQKIPYGETITYGEIARQLKTSARAVGNAVAHNEISIIIPCHRVVGSGGKFTGYSGGVDKKIQLLTLEKINLDERGVVYAK